MRYLDETSYYDNHDINSSNFSVSKHGYYQEFETTVVPLVRISNLTISYESSKTSITLMLLINPQRAWITLTCTIIHLILHCVH